MAEYEGSWRNTKGAMGHVAWAVVDIAGFGEGGLAKGAAKKVVSKVAAKIVEKRSVAKTLLSEVDEAAECAVSASKRRVPNPHGKLGSPQHREKVAEVLADMRSRGLAVDTEVPFKIPGGTKDIRYADAVGYRDGVVAEVHQVGRIGKRVGPVKREREAINDLLRAKDNPLMKIIFHPYN
jgi:hypothetical protein